MTDYANFKHGSVVFPLPTDGTGAGGLGATLLRDADPALYHLLEFFADTIRRYIGPRLLAEAAGANAAHITKAVSETLPLNPEPWLLEEYLTFPLLAAYRKSSKAKDIGSGVHFVDDIEVSYVLPPLQAGEAERILPILKAVASVIANRTQLGLDPLYTPPGASQGAHVWQTAGVAVADFKGASFGRFAGIDNLFYPAVVCNLEITEKNDYYVAVADEADGVDLTLDVANPVEDTVTEFIELATYPPPDITSASPDNGTKAGGNTVTLIGTDFLIGQPYTATVGGIAATDVTVASATAVTLKMPAHNAYPTAIVDIVLTDQFGQTATLVAGYTYTTP